CEVGADVDAGGQPVVGRLCVGDGVGRRVVLGLRVSNADRRRVVGRLRVGDGDGRILVQDVRIGDAVRSGFVRGVTVGNGDRRTIVRCLRRGEVDGIGRGVVVVGHCEVLLVKGDLCAAGAVVPLLRSPVFVPGSRSSETEANQVSVPVL